MRGRSAFTQKLIIAVIGLLLVSSVWLTVATYRLISEEGRGTGGKKSAADTTTESADSGKRSGAFNGESNVEMNFHLLGRSDSEGKESKGRKEPEGNLVANEHVIKNAGGDISAHDNEQQMEIELRNVFDRNAELESRLESKKKELLRQVRDANEKLEASDRLRHVCEVRLEKEIHANKNAVKTASSIDSSQQLYEKDTEINTLRSRITSLENVVKSLKTQLILAQPLVVAAEAEEEALGQRTNVGNSKPSLNNKLASETNPSEPPRRRGGARGEAVFKIVRRRSGGDEESGVATDADGNPLDEHGNPLEDEDEHRSFRRHQGNANYNNAYDQFGAPPDADEIRARAAEERRRRRRKKGERDNDVGNNENNKRGYEINDVHRSDVNPIVEEKMDGSHRQKRHKEEKEEVEKGGSSDALSFHGILDSAIEAERRKLAHTSSSSSSTSPTIPVVIFAYNRARSLQRTIDRVLGLLEREQNRQTTSSRNNRYNNFTLFVSQDSLDFPDVTDLVSEYEKRGKLHHLIHRRSLKGMRPIDVENGWASYYAIAHHYKFAISEIFDKFPEFDKIIILEEDIRVGSDFFDYMSATSFLLDTDETILCVSGWNDNGRKEFIGDATALYRSDFFPGLGWMSSRRVWNELRQKWPNGFWDDWLRQPANRKDRACIRPEVSRVSVSCDEHGASAGQFCEHISRVQLVDSFLMNVQHGHGGAREGWRGHFDYLSSLTKHSYDAWLKNALSSSVIVNSVSELREKASAGRPARLAFHNNFEFVTIAESIGLMSDFKDGVPRTAYNGVVSFKMHGTLVHLYATYKYEADPSY